MYWSQPTACLKNFPQSLSKCNIFAIGMESFRGNGMALTLEKARVATSFAPPHLTLWGNRPESMPFRDYPLNWGGGRVRAIGWWHAIVWGKPLGRDHGPGGPSG